jgi:hypothetical protein
VVLRRQSGYKKPEDVQGHIYSAFKNFRNVIYQQ